MLEYSQALEKLLQGNAIIVVDNCEEYLAVNVTKYQSRSITEPPTSVVVKGPREGFNESLKYNLEGFYLKKCIKGSLSRQ